MVAHCNDTLSDGFTSIHWELAQICGQSSEQWASLCIFFSFLVEPCLTFPCVARGPGKCWTDLDETKSLILNRIILDFFLSHNKIKAKIHVFFWRGVGGVGVVEGSILLT